MENQPKPALRKPSNPLDPTAQRPVDQVSPDVAASAPIRCEQSGSDTAERDDIQQRLAQQAARIADLSAILEQQRAEFQHSEIALVTRIADVDDDRRLTASRLQRTWQSQRDDMLHSLQRRGAWWSGILLLYGISLAIAAVFFYAQLDRTRRLLAADVDGLRQKIERIQSADTLVQRQLTQEKLAQLSAAVRAISDSLNAAPTLAVTASPVSEPAGEPTAEPASAQSASIAESSRLPSRDTPAALPTGERETSPALPELPPASNFIAPFSPSDAMLPIPDPAPVADRIAEIEPEPRIPDTETTALPARTDPERLAVGETPFTLQLMGFPSLDALQKFASRFQLPAEVYYLEESYRGRPWFVLIHSLYASRESANTAIAKLPSELAKLDIWVRKLDSSVTLTRLNASAH